MHAAASLLKTALRPVSDDLVAASSASPAQPSPSTLLALTTGLARGDDAAWTQFHREHGPGIFRYLLAQTRGDDDLAQDALQQTYLRIAKHARPCEIAPMFASWLYTLARSALSDCRRRRRTFWQLLQRHAANSETDNASEADPRTTAAATANDTALSAALERALAQLDAADRSLLEEKYFTGLSVRTLAERLDVTPKAVESRLTRARAELRRLMTSALNSPL